MHLTDRNILMKCLRIFERRVYKYSDAIVTISEDMKKHIISLGADNKKIHVINNWADTTSIRPIHKIDNRLFDEYKIDKSKFSVVYAGDIGVHQRLEMFLDVAAEIEKTRNDIQFIFWGNGAYTDKIREGITNRKIKNFYVLPLQPIDRISEVYGSGDIDIVSLEKGMTKLALPSKIWSIMASGRPILALLDKESEIAREIEKNFGYIIDDMSVLDIAKLISVCADNKGDLERKGSNARMWVCKNNERLTQTKKYYDIMSNLVIVNE